jgi:hypothetical protein
VHEGESKPKFRQRTETYVGPRLAPGRRKMAQVTCLAPWRRDRTPPETDKIRRVAKSGLGMGPKTGRPAHVKNNQNGEALR